jgi:acyl-homoserine lactone acylase PvdQ
MSGASFRIIVDLSDWERAVGASNPGQSGDPDSPHYRDLFALWANDRYFPVPYARAKVEARTETFGDEALMSSRGAAATEDLPMSRS